MMKWVALLVVIILLGSFLIADFVSKYAICFGPFCIKPFEEWGTLIFGSGVLLAVVVVLFTVIVKKRK